MPTPEARRSRRRIWIISILAGAISVAALVGAGLAFKQARDVGRSSRLSICMAEKTTRAVFRDVLIDAEAQSLASVTSPAARAAIVSFYDRSLSRLRAIDCARIVSKGVNP